MKPNELSVAGVILAGGRSHRFEGGRKEEALLLGRPLIAHVIERARPQVAALSLSRAEAGKAGEKGLDVVVDELAGAGPLAGLHAALKWASSRGGRVRHLQSFACDTPLIPADLVTRLLAAIERTGAKAAIPSYAGVLQPTLGLWSLSLESAARRRLEAGRASLMGLAEEARAEIVDFADAGEAAFFNVNSAEDLEALSALLA